MPADPSHEPAPRPPVPRLDLGAALADALAAVEALAEEPTRSAESNAAAEQPARTIDPSTIRGMPVRGSLDALTPAGMPALRPVERPLTDLAQAQADLAVTRKRYQKLTDEADELRRRLQKAEMDLPQAGARQVLHAILPALDHLDAMLTHFDTQESLTTHGREAVSMLRSEWLRTFSSLQIQAFDALGQPFDPVVHEVIAQIADPSLPPGHVVRQVGRGYLHAGRLLRSARVVVVAAPAEPDTP